MKQLLVVGACGQGKMVSEIARLCGYDSILIFDDNPQVAQCGRDAVVGNIQDVSKYEGEVFIAIGNAQIRENLMNQFADRRFPTLIHPSATIFETAEIGAGTVIMAGAVVTADAKISRGCIINTCASVDHDCVAADYVHVSAGAHVAGTVRIGKGTWVGVGATISNNLTICGGCLIGAGAVVVRDITQEGIYVGVPARLLKK